MKKSLSLILVFVLFAPVCVIAGWKDGEGKPVPPNGSLGMSVGYIRIVIEPGEPLGKYTVHASVRDRNLKKTIELLSIFEAVETNTQHN